MRRLPLAAVLILAFPVPLAAQTIEEVNGRIDVVLGDHTAFAEAFDAVQAAVNEGDAEAFAEWVAYPITVAATGDGEEITLETPDDVIAHYDAFITDEIIEAVSTQLYEELFVNAEGIMFGNGELWLSGVCADDACAEFEVKIITIQSAPGE
jgi:hypothetical protein